MNWDNSYNVMQTNGYWSTYLGHWATPIGVAGMAFGGLLLAILVVWSLYWKGRALWRAARLDSRGWFIALLIINTLGVLEIFYIYLFSKKHKK